MPEVVADGETGFVVSSVKEMATVDRLGELDPQVMRARVKEQFSAEAMVAGYEHIYQQLLAVAMKQLGSFAPCSDLELSERLLSARPVQA